MSNEYLIHHNENHDKLGRFTFSRGGSAVKGAASSVGNALLRKKKKPTAPTADIKSRKGGKKSDNTKLSKDEKARLMNSGSLDDINANKDRMSNKELEFAIDRIQKEKNDRANLEKRLADLNGPEEQSKIEKGAAVVEQAVKTGMTMKDLTEKGMKVWNFMADIHNINATPGDKWPSFDENGKPKSNEDGPIDVIDLVQKGSMSEIWENRDKLTTDELKAAKDRHYKLEEIQKLAKEEETLNAQIKADAVVEKESKKQQKANEKAEKAEIKAKEKAEKKAAKEAAKAEKKIQKEQAKNNPTKDVDWSSKNADSNDINWDRPSKYDWDKQLKKNERDAYNMAKQQNQDRDRNRKMDVQVYDNSYNDRPDSTVDTSRSYNVHTRPTHDYQPSDAVKDFIGIYYGKEAPETRRAEAIIDAAVIGSELYKKHKRNKYYVSE